MKQVIFYQGTKKLPEIFRKEDVDKLIDTIENISFYGRGEWPEFNRARDKAIVMTIYLLALRPLEACALRFDDFNTNNRTVMIRAENNKVKKDRVLPIPDKLLETYKEYLAFPRERFWRGSPYLFPTFTSLHLSSQRWKHIFKKILKEAGLYERPVGCKLPKYRSYTLRHTRASELYNKTHDIFLTANLLGHADIRQTLVYLHNDDNYLEHMKKQLDRLN